MENDGYNSVQLGCVNGTERNVKKPQRVECEKAGVPFKRFIREFRVTPDAFPPIGSEITCRHFVPGQYVDIQGKTLGKGTQGVMKRWGFKGQPASHGASKSHRSLGSTGAGTTPGKVWKGKKMPGRMGNKMKTSKNLLVFKIYPEFNVIAVVGSIAGGENGIVTIKDSNKRWKEPVGPPPFPAHIREKDEIIKSLRKSMDLEEAEGIKGPCPMPWPLQRAKNQGWHVPDIGDIQHKLESARIHQIASGELLRMKQEEEKAAEKEWDDGANDLEK